METESNEERRAKLTEVATLKDRLENNHYESMEDKKADFKEYEKLSALLDWKN